MGRSNHFYGRHIYCWHSLVDTSTAGIRYCRHIYGWHSLLVPSSQKQGKEDSIPSGTVWCCNSTAQRPELRPLRAWALQVAAPYSVSSQGFAATIYETCYSHKRCVHCFFACNMAHPTYVLTELDQMSERQLFQQILRLRKNLPEWSRMLLYLVKAVWAAPVLTSER